MALFLATFLITIALQMITSQIVTGTSFFNHQARNVWFGIYGQFNWIENWQKIPQELRYRKSPALIQRPFSNTLLQNSAVCFNTILDPVSTRWDMNDMSNSGTQYFCTWFGLPVA